MWRILLEKRKQIILCMCVFSSWYSAVVAANNPHLILLLLGGPVHMISGTVAVFLVGCKNLTWSWPFQDFLHQEKLCEAMQGHLFPLYLNGGGLWEYEPLEYSKRSIGPDPTLMPPQLRQDPGTSIPIKLIFPCIHWVHFL